MATVPITVELQIDQNPPVKLDQRKPIAQSGDTIQWQKIGNATFEFTSLSPAGDGTAFSDPATSGNGNRYSSVFTATEKKVPGQEYVEYPYTLTVTANGQTYTTTIAASEPDDRRAVIRN